MFNFIQLQIGTYRNLMHYLQRINDVDRKGKWGWGWGVGDSLLSKICIWDSDKRYTCREILPHEQS